MNTITQEPQIIGKYIISVLKVSPDIKTHNRILRQVGMRRIEPDQWYPQILFLRFFKRLLKAKGDDYLFDLGKKLVQNTMMPPYVDNFHYAIRAFDLGYTIIHRNQIGAMFGQKSKNELRTEIIAANPYPCPFDWGILQQIAKDYASTAKLSHDFTAGCRLDGDHACKYTIDF
ncbi:MAG: hypothetical protein ACQES9_10860 [Myxococcota bacterium]